MLDVSSWKEVVYFGKKEMLAPRYVGPFEIIKGIGPMAFACRDLEAAFEYPGEFHSPIFTMFSWDGNDVKYVLIAFFAYFVGKILGGDQLLVILCGYGTKSLELGTSFLSMTVFVALDRETRSVQLAGQVHSDTQFHVQHLLRKLGSEPCIGQRVILAVS
ncbi:hypothetical protein Tco_0305199 [Tanacetum coccineum]